jgi:tetratricopeptide (TPR) repeat protein
MSCSEVEEQNMAERYLLDQVTEAERDEFEKHYFACRSCFDRLQTHLALQSELRLQTPPASTVAFRPRPSWTWAASLAAALLLIGVGVWWASANLRGPSHAAASSSASASPGAAPATASAGEPPIEQLARVEPPPYAGVVLRGVEDPSQRRFREAMQHYARGDYRAAIPGLLAAVEASPGTPRFRFYLGACYLLTHQTDRAIETLQKAATRDDPAYTEASHFYLAKARLANRDVSDAEAELRETIRMGGAHEAEARTILRQLGK